MAFVAILGMFYWMYKARKGELNLSTKSWHYKLKHWMWDFETYEGKNACPYYWGLIFSVLILPLYIIVRYIFNFIVYLYNKLLNFNKPKVLKYIKLPIIIPLTKKKMYNKIYRNSKKWLLNGLLGIILLIAGINLILSFYKLFVLNWKSAVLLFSLLPGVILHAVMLITENEYFIEHYWDYVMMIVEGLFGIIKLPFILIYSLLKIPFEFIFKIYTNHCPPIKWED